ncbi:GTP cyclohydrolase I [Labilithrix luteola]|uniref:GTP cyclohydrolase I n=1 Tax=Labilithrix luteola TaxID=1391654 RepID=A0A0K1PVN5_9BACT|nr:GTP cyclohydrolase I [Labilithrix luteola]AKU97593.1 GTP cyclohydrolase I [Labilithrix luteola]
MSIDRTAAARAIDAFLRALGRDPETEPDLAGTGARVADAYVDELCAGYGVDTRALLASSRIPVTLPGLVIVRDIPLSTMCPHHLLPATGTVTMAMLPSTHVVGLGTLAALANAHARRLTLQETIGEAIVTDLESVLAPQWVACRLVLSHACMVVRGERAVGARVETVAVRGAAGTDLLSHVHKVLGVGA